MIVYRLTDSGVERLEVAYVIPELVKEIIVHESGALVTASRHPAVPRPQGDDWWGRFPPAG